MSILNIRLAISEKSSGEWARKPLLHANYDTPRKNDHSSENVDLNEQFQPTEGVS